MNDKSAFTTRLLQYETCNNNMFQAETLRADVHLHQLITAW